MKKYLIVLFTVICLAGCKEVKETSILTPVIESKEPQYQCERCKKMIKESCVIEWNFGPAGISKYCSFCMKEAADKYLPKVK